jgi:hypothetical protein
MGSWPIPDLREAAGKLMALVDWAGGGVGRRPGPAVSRISMVAWAGGVAGG